MYNLLIADDEKIVRRGIKTLVDYQSLDIGDIIEAENGEEALEIIKQGNIHIVLADINMPRLNGLHLAKNIKEFDSNMVIALITGYDYFEYVLAALKIGIDDYILKPVSKNDITELLIKLIDKRKMADAAMSITLAANKLTKHQNIPDESIKKILLNEINKNLQVSSFSLGDLAATIGYNPTYLSTLFRKTFGLNFRDYILDLRLERAKILLLSTQMKSYEIAQAIGIDDASYLSTCFKRKLGVTISEYRSMGGKI